MSSVVRAASGWPPNPYSRLVFSRVTWLGRGAGGGTPLRGVQHVDMDSHIALAVAVVVNASSNSLDTSTPVMSWDNNMDSCAGAKQPGKTTDADWGVGAGTVASSGRDCETTGCDDGGGNSKDDL